MPKRTILIYAAVVLITATAGFFAARWLTESGSRTTLATGTLLEPRRTLPAFVLLDARRQPFTQANLQGHWSLLFFGFTHCPDLCPTTLTTLAAMHKRMLAAHATTLPAVVFISVDAKRDTPEQLTRYVPFFDSEFIGVTANTQSQIETFARQLGVAVIVGPEVDGNYAVDHSGALFVIDPSGKLAAILTGPHTTEGIIADFARIVGSRA